jgi:hypothetical protein
MKAKQMYRKKNSFLNKALDTTEIKQCSKKLQEIVPMHVAWHTYMKQPKLVFGTDVIYKECSQKVREHMSKNIKNNDHGYFSNYYTVSFFVKQALCIIADKNADKKDEIDILNKLWSRFSKTVKKDGFGNIIPMMDVSFYMQAMDSEEFYTAIGFSILIAERSNFGKRILAIDHQSTWINLDGCEDFVDLIENIHQSMSSRSNTVSNIDNAIELFAHSLSQSKSTRRFIENMSIVIFSDFASLLSIDICKEQFIKFCSYCPNIICWNMSKYKLIEPFYKTDDAILIMSGLSNGSFNSFINLLQIINIGKTLPSIFENVSMVLNSNRYDILESYLKLCVKA